MKKNNFIGIAIFFLLWFLISQFQIIDKFFLPDPINVIQEALRLLISGEINLDIYFTLSRIFISFILAAVIGISLGLIIGAYPKLYYSTESLIDFFRSLPASAMFPLFLLVFGVDDKSKIAVAVFCIGIIILFTTAQAIMNSKKSRIEAARLMGATKKQIFQEILFWEALPQIITGLRTSISLCLILIILTEMIIGTQYGLGRRIIDFQYNYSISSLYAAILLTGLLGYILNQIFVQIEKKFIHWSGK
jgi:NitT/TauT family transport system permease protein